MRKSLLVLAVTTTLLSFAAPADAGIFGRIFGRRNNCSYSYSYDGHKWAVVKNCAPRMKMEAVKVAQSSTQKHSPMQKAEAVQK